MRLEHSQASLQPIDGKFMAYLIAIGKTKQICAKTNKLITMGFPKMSLAINTRGDIIPPCTQRAKQSGASHLREIIYALLEGQCTE
jgi:hypothetical protein